MGNLFDKLKYFFSNKKMEIVIVGLENSGKSTLASQLSLNKVIKTGPTIGLDIRSFQKGNVMLNMWDLGGQGFVNKFNIEVNGLNTLWELMLLFLLLIQLMFFNQKDRIKTAKFELHRMFDNSNLKGIPLLVIGNKIDLVGHFNEEQIVEELNLDYLQNNQWVLIMASALKGTHIEQVLDWLIKKSKK